MSGKRAFLAVCFVRLIVGEEDRYFLIGIMRVNYTCEGVYSQGTYPVIPVFL